MAINYKKKQDGFAKFLQNGNVKLIQEASGSGGGELSILQSDGNSGFYTTGQDTVFLPNNLTPGSSILYVGSYRTGGTAPSHTNNQSLSFSLEEGPFGPQGDFYTWVWVADNPSASGSFTVDANLGSEFGYWAAFLVEFSGPIIIEWSGFDNNLSSFSIEANPITEAGFGLGFAWNATDYNSIVPDPYEFYYNTSPHGNSYYVEQLFAQSPMATSGEFLFSGLCGFSYNNALALNIIPG